VFGALLVTYGFASRVEFEIASGSAVPTQVALVPAIVLLPSGFVPLLALGGLLLGIAPEIARGDRHLHRLLMPVVSATYALGPAIVLTVAGEPDLSWRSVPIYLLALGAASVFDLGTGVGHQWMTLRVRPSLLLNLMVEVMLVDLALAPIGVLVADGTSHVAVAPLAVVPFLGLLQWFARERRRRVDQALELSRAYRGTAMLLGDVVEADDAYTGSHSRDVVDLALAVADFMGLDPAERQRVEFTALLHDVGKIRVPTAIINKPGPLDEDEIEVMRRHTIIGEELLERVGGLLSEVGALVRSCHERWDGKGYPDGLLAEEIPLIARIVCCCDAYNAMTTDRPYRKALSTVQATTELRSNAGTQFDPAVVRALIQTVGRSEPPRRISLAAAA
jgi:HD-GYP domain-containing protein (c-di-GMP phosphodiesterase class II)